MTDQARPPRPPEHLWRVEVPLALLPDGYPPRRTRPTGPFCATCHRTRPAVDLDLCLYPPGDDDTDDPDPELFCSWECLASFAAHLSYICWVIGDDEEPDWSGVAAAVTTPDEP